MRHHWYIPEDSIKKIKEHDIVKKCENCNQYYHQITEVQPHYNSTLDFDVCPHCSACNGVSDKLMFINTKLTQKGLYEAVLGVKDDN